MSTGFDAITLLKAAPEPAQIAERLEGGPWRGIELCLMPRDVETDERVAAAVERARSALPQRDDFAVTAEAPVSWPSGAHVRVDRLDDEARAGIERSAAFAAGIGSPVLTIHLFTPKTPEEFIRDWQPDGPGIDAAEVERFLRFFADACLGSGVTPLIENVPPILRMRQGGVFLSPIGGHWRDLLEWRRRIPELGFTFDTSHAALYRTFAGAYPSPFGLADHEGLDLGRYVEELGPACEVAHVSNAHGILGEGLPYADGDLDLDPVVRRLAALVPYIVAEISEPDPTRSPSMKAGYRAIERVIAAPEGVPIARPRRRLRPEPFDWQSVVGRPDPLPSVLELQELLGGRRVLITGGGGSIARSLATLILGFRPELVTLLDSHEASLTADRRSRDSLELVHLDHVLCDIRDHGRIATEMGQARPHLVFHLAAYKHVDWAEIYPDEFLDTNLHGSWNVLRAADDARVDTVLVASTDKAALAASYYGRTKRFMEQLTAYAARDGGARRTAIRFVNVLGSAGSASELFLRQTRAGVPLTITDTGMLRFWITMSHAVTAAAHAALLSADGVRLATPAGAPELTVGELATRIWQGAGLPGEPSVDLLGIRRGETMGEVLTGAGERLAEERYRGVVEIESALSTAAASWVAERIGADTSREEAREVWREAMERPGLIVPAQAPP
ncbi:MAG TPA: polysaccharide biosynthesis protein [Thermoleophilaceae bacterium]|nr:polysaccharide biosynthesis protein [Thermoleophilaceae bacterium]